MAYTVPKLTDFSASALDTAMRELLSALDQASIAVDSENDWKLFRDHWMARKNGILTQLNDQWLKAAPKEAKREVGQRVNKIKAQVEEKVDKATKGIAKLMVGARFPKQSVPYPAEWAAFFNPSQPLDITLPGIRRPIGAEHPVIKTMNEIVFGRRDRAACQRNAG